MASLKDVFGSPNYNNQDLIELELSKIIYCMFYAVVMLNDLTLKIYAFYGRCEHHRNYITIN